MILSIATTAEPDAIGNWLVIAIFILGGLLGLAHLWRMFFPTPPEWKGHIESVRKELRDGDESVRQACKEEDDKLHGRISSMRHELIGDIEKVGTKVEVAAKSMNDTYNATVGQMGKLEGRLDQINQTVCHNQAKIDNHIATDK